MGIIGRVGGSLACDGIIWLQLLHPLLAFLMSVVMPGQYTLNFARSFIPVVPWWVECSVQTTSCGGDKDSHIIPLCVRVNDFASEGLWDQDLIFEENDTIQGIHVIAQWPIFHQVYRNVIFVISFD